MLRDLIASQNVRNAIIFCNRKVEVAILHKSLVKHGFNAGALHGDMDQKARMETLDKFRAGELKLLAASDVAARGLDIPDVSHIFNFDLPWQPDDYVHRIGRTGRAGKEGVSMSLVTVDELKSLKDIEKMLGEPVDWIGEPPSDEDFADAGKKRRGRGGRAGPQRGRGGRSGAPAQARGDDKGRERQASAVAAAAVNRVAGSGVSRARKCGPRRAQRAAAAEQPREQREPRREQQPRHEQRAEQREPSVGAAARAASGAPGARSAEPTGGASGRPAAASAAAQRPRAKPSRPASRAASVSSAATAGVSASRKAAARASPTTCRRSCATR